MIWRLTYCNKKGVEARIDIIKGNRTPVEIVQGSGNPFTLSYKLDKNDKSGHIMTSSADIEFFETEEFNIDKLKTSNETELKVEYFEDNVLSWSGFVLPDFFSREIGSPNIVRMTASDRLTALKGVTLSDLPSRVSLRDLIELSLGQTGLSLGLVSQIQISQGSTNILDSEILSQRLTDVRGRSISCYDILMSIMVGTNSTIRQRKGQWQIYNKLEHELRAPTIFFDKVERGAIRTIQPVASSVGVYNEFGGNRLHPNNYDFSLGLANWTGKNGFNGSIDNKVVSFFLGGTPIYQPDVTTNDYLVNYNDWITNETNLDTAPFLESNNIPISSTQDNTVEVEVDISAVMAEKLSSFTAISFLRYAIIATNGVDRYALTTNGIFEAYDPEKIDEHSIILKGGQQEPLLLVSPPFSKSEKRKGLLEVENVNDFHVNIRIYGSSFDQYVNVEFVSVKFDNKTETPKGNLYKTTQGSNFTKLHDVETVIFGDYIRSGLNGYFYNYPIDDTSNLYLPNGELSPPQWVTAFDTTERPLLHHISRQKSRLFSVAHDILKANINVESFDPLAIFQDCKGGKYVVVSANFDFLRSEVDVELEQIAYDNTILKRDFIYSYFGEGEDTIKSIGGIAGGGGGTGGGVGGGMTSEQLEMLTNLADWWKLDEENDAIYSEKSVYSLKGVSALGLGSEGGGGGDGGADMLDSWANYTTAKANYYVPASLLVPFRNDALSRLTSLESGSATSIVTTGAGNAITSLTKSGSVITANKGLTFSLSTHNHNTLYKPIGYVPSWGEVTGKPTTFAPSAHTHTIANITGLQTALNGKEPSFTKNTAFNKNFDTTAGTVAQGNDSRILNGQTAFGWGNHSSAGYALNSALTTHTGNTTVHITATERTNWNLAYTNNHTHGNKSVIDALTQGHINVLNKLSLDAQLNIKVDTTLWATGGISALGLGSGGGSGGGGVDMLDAWANYTPAKANYYVPASLLVPFRNDTLSRLTSLESGSATSIVTTGSGNAITSLTKAGSVITANKGLTFALASHTHTIAQITGLQGALNLKATQSDIDTAIDGVLMQGKWARTYSVNSARTLPLLHADGTPFEAGYSYEVTAKTTGTSSITMATAIISCSTSGIFSIQILRQLGTGSNHPKLFIDGNVPSVSIYNHNQVYPVIVEAIRWQGFETPLAIVDRFASTHIANKANPHAVTTSQIGAVDLTTAQTITGAKTFNANITLGINRYIQGTDNYTGIWNVDDSLWRFGSSKTGSVANIRSEKVGIGTDNPLYKLDVSGTGRFTGSLTASASVITPKVDFGNGFTIEPSGTELVFKYNGVIKQRMLSNGTILATGGITALST